MSAAYGQSINNNICNWFCRHFPGFKYKLTGHKEAIQRTSEKTMDGVWLLSSYFKSILNNWIHPFIMLLSISSGPFNVTDTSCRYRHQRNFESSCYRANISSEEMKDKTPSSNTSTSTTQPVIRQRKKPHMLPPIEKRRYSVSGFIFITFNVWNKGWSHIQEWINTLVHLPCWKNISR